LRRRSTPPARFARALLALALLAAAGGAAVATAVPLAPTLATAHAGSVTRADSLAATPPALEPPGPDYLARARATFGPENRAYATQRVIISLCGPLYGILCGLLVMFTGLSARYRDIAEGLGHRLYVRVLVFFTLYSSTIFLLGLPLAWFDEFALEHQYGLSTQSLGDWFVDSFKGQVASVVIVGVLPLLSLAWRTIQAHPRRWWLWLSLATLPVALTATLLEPVVLDPVFNKFMPLEDNVLRYEILSLGARAGIPARNVYQVDMSKRTRKLNAYVNGFGASQRIVIWDTTLKRMKRDEILFVMGHEMGHYMLNHVWKFLGLVGIGAFFVFWLCAKLTGLWLRLFGQQWGVRDAGDLAVMPVLALSLTIATLTVLPIANASSRLAEHEADVFGLEITRDNDAAARSFLKLAQDNRSDPDPPAWIRILLYDHPPLADRIRFALHYRPWMEGKPNRFFHEHDETLLRGRSD
jgi:Zn-dependent protease with chaperone function